MPLPHLRRKVKNRLMILLLQLLGDKRHIQYTMLHSTSICEYISYYTANVNFLLDYLDNTFIFMFNAAIGSRIICYM